MSADIKEQLLTQITHSPKFLLQIDESAGVAHLLQLLWFVRYCFEENIHEHFMFCRLLTERITGSGMFKPVNDYITLQDILGQIVSTSVQMEQQL